MAVEVIGNGGPDGTTFGLSATEKISFFGATTVVQQTGAASATDTATTLALANALRTAMVNLGLITTV